MKVLVTGAAGFIGGQLMHALWKNGHTAIGVDNYSYGSADNLHFDDHDFSADVIKMDIRDKEGMKALFEQEKFDIVYNIAGIAPLPDCQSDPVEAVSVNTLGLVNVLENARRTGVKHVIQASTNAMYENETEFPTVESKFNPPTLIYPNTKYCGERFCQSFADTYGMNITCLRFANVYGERQGEGGEGGVISIFCKLLVQNKPLTVFGNGEQTRDFVYAGDIAQAAAKAVALTGYNVINISTGKETSLNSLLDAFKSACGHELTVNYAPARSGDIFRSVLSNKKLEALLGFVPQMDTEHGIPKTYNDYLARRKEGL